MAGNLLLSFSVLALWRVDYCDAKIEIATGDQYAYLKDHKRSSEHFNRASEIFNSLLVNSINKETERNTSILKASTDYCQGRALLEMAYSDFNEQDAKNGSLKLEQSSQRFTAAGEQVWGQFIKALRLEYGAVIATNLIANMTIENENVWRERSRIMAEEAETIYRELGIEQRAEMIHALVTANRPVFREHLFPSLVLPSPVPTIPEITEQTEELGGSVENGYSQSVEKKEEKLMNILFVSSDPTDAARLRMGKESSQIEDQILKGINRENLGFEQKHAAKVDDFTFALLQHKPDIIHFSGHGTVEGGLCFEDEVGKVHEVSPEALGVVFQSFPHPVKCVLLNACYARAQAEVIAEHVNCVIGMNKAISDKASIAYSVGFYQMLASGSSIDDSHGWGCAQIKLKLPNREEHLTPELIKFEQDK